MWLSNSDFSQVVAHTPLVSLDFVITNASGEWLLGQRFNRPAQGQWFVPGGRVRKDETLDAAALRLTTEELGQRRSLADMHFLGVYEHFYTDSQFDSDVSTHYVVLAYHFSSSPELARLPREQHGQYQWWLPDEIGVCEDVHANTLGYLPAISSLFVG
ncbi:GDP-mannose mannosyl hydrolase [Halomonas sp. EGI 63088]|uniref:GDP-mannose mannosyl hydrolase n=1 Tax=Halomonas flagellata TaxID=2920385 RepID=A0ABS9S021_9GAMM|nr:GDP-mannose mannosyl hydrolase [Halomonas flagellata]MCH4565432.1 GDP-mannose mannosyl hydrolase [Halomonas flagellata]